MRTLAARDAAMLLDFVAELHHVDDALAFPPSLLARLRKLVPCDEVGYGDVDPSARRSRVHVWNHVDGDEGVAIGDEWWERPGDRERWWRVRDTNPICAHWLSNGDWATPCKVSDFATLREFRRTPIYDEFICGLADYLLAVALPVGPGRQRCFTFSRLGRDFDERDRLVLRLLQPHLAARAEAAAGVEALAAAENGGGGIEKLTPREREILGHVVRGLQNDAIALELGIAQATVAKHLERVYRKLGVPNRTAAAAFVDRRHEASA